MKPIEGLLAWAREALENKWVYWYGTCGYECTKGLLERKTAQYGSPHYAESRQKTYKQHIADKRVCSDCIGLFKSYAWDKDDDIETRESKYASNGQPDKGAKQALNDCKVKGVISTIPEIPGLAVWTKTGGHIGLYMGGGKVIEMRGFGHICEENDLIDRSFKTWGLYPYAEYDDDAVEMAKKAANIFARRTLRKGSEGEDVRALQDMLNAFGPYGGLEVDGVYGRETEASVRALQGDNGLTPDGITGPKTWAKLEELLKAMPGSTGGVDPVAPEEPPTDPEQDAWGTLSITEKVELLHKRLLAVEGGESGV